MPEEKTGPTKYISLMEASELCDYSQEYLSLRARQKKLKAVKMGRNWVTTKEWLDEYVKQVAASQKKEVAIPIKPGKLILGPTDVPEARTTSETLRKFWKKPLTSRTIDTFSALIKTKGDKKARRILRQERKIVKSEEFSKIKALIDKKAREVALKTKQLYKKLAEKSAGIAGPVISKLMGMAMPWLEEKSVSLFNVLKRKFVIIAKIVPQGLLVSIKTDKHFVGFIIKGRMGWIISGFTKALAVIKDVLAEGYKRLIENLSMFCEYVSVTFRPLEADSVLIGEGQTQKIEWRKLGRYLGMIVLLVLISSGLVLGAKGELTYSNVKKIAEQTMAGVGESFYIVFQGEAPNRIGKGTKHLTRNTTEFISNLPQTGGKLARQAQKWPLKTKSFAEKISKAGMGGISQTKVIISSGFYNLSDTLSDTANEIPNTVNNMNSAIKGRVAYLSDIENWQAGFVNVEKMSIVMIEGLKNIGQNIGNNVTYLYSRTNSGVRTLGFGMQESSRALGNWEDRMIEKIIKAGANEFVQFRSDAGLVIKEPEIVGESVSLLVDSCGGLGGRFAGKIKDIAYIAGESVSKAKKHFTSTYRIGLNELGGAYKCGPENIVDAWQKVEAANQKAKDGFENGAYLAASGINSGVQKGFVIVRATPGKVIASASGFTSVSRDALVMARDNLREIKDLGLKLPGYINGGLSNYGLAIKNGAKEFRNSLKDGFSLAGQRLAEKIRGIKEVKKKEEAKEIGGSYLNFKKITSVFSAGYDKLVDFWYENFFEPQIVEIPAIIKEPGEVREVSRIVQPLTEVTKKTVSEVKEVERIREIIASADLEALKKKDEDLLKEIQRVGNELILLSGHFSAGLSTAPNAPLNIGSNGFNVEGHTNVHSLSVNADLGVGRDLSVSGSTVLGTDTTDLLTVRARSLFSANADFGGGLDVTSGGLTVGGNNFLVDDSGNLTTAGSITIIGTTTLSSALSVGGDLNVDGNTILGNATSSDLVSFNSRINSGIQPAYDNLYDLGNGDEWLRWRTGYFGTSVGIGGTATTTSDALTVSGAFTINPSLNLIASSTSGNLIFATNGVERTRVTSEGIVGIGTTTPTGLFNIASADPKLYITDTNAGADKKHWWLYSNAGDFQIGTTSDSLATNTTFLTIKGDTGNVGIGIADPARKFEVSDDSSFRLVRLTSNNDIGAVIEFNPTATGGVGWEIGSMADASATGGGTFSFTDSGGNVRMVLDSIYGRVGIGTTTPTSALHLAKDAEDMDIRLESDYFNWTMGIDNSDGGKFKIASSTALGTNDRLVIDGRGYVGIGTSSPTQSLVVNGSTYITGGLGVGVATTTPGVIQASGDFYMGGNLMVLGNATVIGSTLSDTLTVNATINSNLIPDQNATRDFGSAAYYWKTGYIATLNVNNLAAASTTISGTSNESFTINSNNATADTEDMNLIFYRGTVVPNALITWDSTNNKFDFNQGVFMQNDSADGATISLEVRGLAGQTADLLKIASSTGNSYLNVTNVGNVGIGTTSPRSLLNIAGTRPQLTLTDTSAGLDDKHWFLSSQGGNLYIGTSTDALNATSTYLTINKSGYMGIGTAAPENSLEVNGASKLSGVYVGLDGSTTISSGASSGSLTFRGGGTSQGGRIDAIGGSGTIANSGAILFYSGIGAAPDWGERMRLDASGNVGIGTTTPNNKLGIYSTTKAAIGFSGSANDTNKWTMGMDVSNGGRFSIASSTALGTTDRFVIDGAGNVGIGTTSPGVKLDVNGSINIASGYQIKQNNNPILWYQGASTNNMWVGNNSGRSASTGTQNVGVGSDVLISLSSGGGNVGVGPSVLYANTTGSYNTGIGAGSVLFNSTSSSYSTAVGYNTLSQNKTNFQTAVGYAALASNTYGYANTALGASALRNNTTGEYNLGIGVETLDANTTGSYNTAVGSYDTMLYNQTGSYNVAVGQAAMSVGTSPSYNVAVGYAAGQSITGNNNVAIGYAAGPHSPSGGVFLGNQAGYYETGSNKLFIDNAQRASEADARAKALIYGIFDAAVANQYLTINANVGIGTTTPNSLLHIFGSTPKFYLSDSSASANQKHWFFQTTGGSLQIGTTTDGLVNTSSYRAMTILQNGNVGVGTTSPTYQLSITSASQQYLSLEDSRYTNWWARLRNDGTFSLNTNGVQFQIATNNNGPGGATIHNMGTLSNNGLGIITNNAVRMYFDTSGNVGIGTTSPGAKLHVYRGASGATASADAGLILENSSTDNSINFLTGDATEPGIRFISPTSARQGYIRYATAATPYMRFGVNNSEVMRIQGGNVGIGTTSPGARLHIQEDAASGVYKDTYAKLILDDDDARIQVRSSDVGTYGSSIILSSGAKSWSLMSTAINNSNKFTIGYRQSSSNEDIDENTNKYLTIDTSGNVGIGTTTPNSLLHIFGSTPKFYLSDSSASANQKHWFFQTTGGSLQIGTTTDGLVDTSSYRALTITNAGNVGIGAASPNSKLEANITARTTAFSAGNALSWADFHIINPTDTQNAAAGIAFTVDASGYNVGNAVGIAGVKSSSDGTYQMDLVFITDPTAAGAEERMRITSTGNVGIGTTSPASLLTVAGGTNTKITIDGSAAPNITFNLSSVPKAEIGYGATGYGGTHPTGGYFHSSDGISFGSLGGANWMYINSSGNVGIGTTSPNNKLGIYSTTKAAIGFSGAANDTNKWTMGMDVSNGGRFSIASSSALGTSDRFVIDGAGNVGIGTTSPGMTFAVNGTSGGTSAWTNMSHSSLKENFEDVGVLSGISQLNIKEWQFKEGASPGDTFRHLSPFSEDFRAKFGLGDSDFYIQSLDVAGVALKGVQEIIRVIDLTSAATSSPSMAIDSSGNISIGTTTASSKLNVGGDVAAEGFVNVSTKDIKTGIEYLNEKDYDEALESILGAKVATYEYKSDANDANCHSNDLNNPTQPPLTLRGGEGGVTECSRRLGLIAEEAPKEVLSASGKGVDLYKMISLAWAGMKAQQKQIDKLAMNVEELEKKVEELAKNPPVFALEGGGEGGLGFGSILSGLKYLGIAIENGIARFQNIVVKSLAIEKSSDSTQSAVGEGIIAAGKTEYAIQTDKITEKSKVFITWRGDYGSRWWIDRQADGEAVVKIAQAMPNDTRFDWMVVGVEETKISNDPSSAKATEGEQVPMANDQNQQAQPQEPAPEATPTPAVEQQTEAAPEPAISPEPEAEPVSPPTPEQAAETTATTTAVAE